MGNLYLWKADEPTNRIAEVRYAHEEELADLPGVIGLGMGKDHIIVYVSDEKVEVPPKVEDVPIVKICRKEALVLSRSH